MQYSGGIQTVRTVSLQNEQRKAAEQAERAADIANGRLIRTGVGTPRALHASSSIPACMRAARAYCGAQGTVKSMQEPAFAPAEATCGWMQRRLAQQ